MSDKNQNIKVTIEKQEDVFHPIKITMTFVLSTKEEYMDLQREFKEGEFAEYSTAYSAILYQILDELKQI